MDNDSNNIGMFLLVLLLVIVGCAVLRDMISPCTNTSTTTLIIAEPDTVNDIVNDGEISSKEKFGALQSLYSNDGPQDAYLTIENDPNLYYDPYGYWRGVTWDLPTRNLSTISYYPYLYERYIDRYGTLYPYWSL
jgi:hypothetical protein